MNCSAASAIRCGGEAGEATSDEGAKMTEAEEKLAALTAILGDDPVGKARALAKRLELAEDGWSKQQKQAERFLANWRESGLCHARVIGGGHYCGLAELPTFHTWVFKEDIGRITCVGCYRALTDGDSLRSALAERDARIAELEGETARLRERVAELDKQAPPGPAWHERPTSAGWWFNGESWANVQPVVTMGLCLIARAGMILMTVGQVGTLGWCGPFVVTPTEERAEEPGRWLFEHIPWNQVDEPAAVWGDALPDERAAWAKVERELSNRRPAEPARADLTLDAGNDTPWPIRDVLKRLADDVDHLLGAPHNCDCHSHEVSRHAVNAARRLLAEPARAEEPKPVEVSERAHTELCAPAGLLTELRRRFGERSARELEIFGGVSVAVTAKDLAELESLVAHVAKLDDLVGYIYGEGPDDRDALLAARESAKSVRAELAKTQQHLSESEAGNSRLASDNARLRDERDGARAELASEQRGFKAYREEAQRIDMVRMEKLGPLEEERANLTVELTRTKEENARLTKELRAWEDWCHDQIHKTKMLKIDKRPSRDWLASVLDDILKDMASDRAEHARHHREEERLTKELEAERLSRLVAERVVELLPIDMFDRLGLDATETAELQGAIETYDRRFLASIPNSSDGIENLPPVSAQPEPKDPPGVRIRDDIRTVRAEVTPAKSSPSRAKLL